MRILLYILGGLVALILLLGLMGPGSYDVSRTKTIDASVENVWPYLSSFEKNYEWSPWMEKDPNAEINYEGESGTVGAKYTWSGNEEVGSGEQTITNVVENELVESRLKFLTPMESEADAYIKIQPAEGDGGSEVTWGFKGENGFMGRIFGLFMDMDAMIGPNFERGLNKLDSLVMSNPNPATPDMDVQVLDLESKMFAGVRKEISMEEMQTFFEENLPKVFQAAGDKVTGMPAGLYYTWDEENQKTDMAAAVPVSGSVDGFEIFKVEGGKALVIDYYGGYEGLGDAHWAIDDYLKANNMEARNPAIEEYITDPSTEPDTTKWLTKVTYYLK